MKEYVVSIVVRGGPELESDLESGLIEKNIRKDLLLPDAEIISVTHTCVWAGVPAPTVNEDVIAERERFPVGTAVNVKPLPDDGFFHSFTGHVRGYRTDYIVVEDQDGDCFDVLPSQLSFNTDAIMHG